MVEGSNLCLATTEKIRILIRGLLERELFCFTFSKFLLVRWHNPYSATKYKFIILLLFSKNLLSNFIATQLQYDEIENQNTLSHLNTSSYGNIKTASKVTIKIFAQFKIIVLANDFSYSIKICKKYDCINLLTKTIKNFFLVSIEKFK